MRTVCSASAFMLMLAAAANAQLTVHVQSASVPAGDTVYIAGSFNGWHPGDRRYSLEPAGPGSYLLTLPDSVRGNIEFKFTLGSWETVELSEAGQSVPNRMITIPASGPITHEASVPKWQDPKNVKTPAHSARPSVRVLSNDFVMPELGRTRRVWLYMPADYATSNKRYPVIYMHDGQNLFDAATAFAGEWGIDETLDSLTAQGEIGALVVGIDNGGAQRMNEYSPWANARYGGGQGDQYVDFIVNTLKPYIDAHYRTRRGRLNTGIAGSSMGGLISLYAALKYPNVFGRAALFSPSLWFAPEIWAVVRHSHISAPHTRFYFVSGGRESPRAEDAAAVVRNQQAMADSLVAIGYIRDRDVAVRVRADGTHSEEFWRREFPAAYQWLFRTSAGEKYR